MKGTPSVAVRLRGALGDSVLVGGSEVGTGKLSDWGTDPLEAHRPLALVLPRTTDEVAQAVRICAAAGVPIVPQGGMTGLVGGANSLEGAVLINVERMRAIEELDATAATITVQAGATLQSVQQAAAEADLLYPLDIGSRGTCTIGGNIATNAGGNRVLRYGMTRDLVLGLEVVMADGTVVTSMNKMLKNNTGYDWKQAFIGCEGTLGIITRAVLRLYPQPRSVNTCLCALGRFDDVYGLLSRARSALSANLSAFEVMWGSFYAYAVEGNANPPLKPGQAAYVLIEASGGSPERDSETFTSFLSECLDNDVISDCVLPKSTAETEALWSVRDRSGELVQSLRPLCNYDVSIETSRVGSFTEGLEERLRQMWPTAEIICFGHLADSNVHIFVRVEDCPFPIKQIDGVFYNYVRECKGSVSAEIGIGLMKKAYLSYSRTPGELALMRLMKQYFDPKGLLNPTKMF